MKILLTGSKGFLGKTIFNELHDEHEIVPLGRTEEGGLAYDITQKMGDLPHVDMVVHAAGKAHNIPKLAAEKQIFFDVNTTGTRNLLDALQNNLPDTFVFISTVAVYGLDFGEGIDERFPLLGNTPYALSKIKAEEIIQNWGLANGVNVIILRLPLIIGHNPPGNLAALFKAIKKGYYFRIGSGQAQKSMVGAPDVAKLLPTLFKKNGTYNLTDGRHPCVNEVDTQIAALFGRKVRSIPGIIMQIVAKIGDLLPGFPLNTARLKKLNATLTFDDSKARRELNWNPESALNSLKFVFN